MSLFGGLGGLVGGLGNALTGNTGTSPGNSANAPGQTTPEPEVITPVEEPTPTPSSAPANYNNGPTSTYIAPKDEEVISSVTSALQSEERDGKVNAADYARRAAIAMQSKLHSEALFEALEAEAYSPLLEKQDADAAYAKSSMTERFVEKAEVQA